MFISFFSHQYKSFFRSSIWQKEVIVNLFIGLFIAYLILNALIAGFFLDLILSNVFPDENPEDMLHQFILYYFAFDLLIRFYLQEIPTMQIRPYLHLPIPKNRLFHHLLFKSLFNIYNLLSLLLFTPFGMKVIAKEYSAAAGFIWIATVVLITLTNSYLTVYFKRQLIGKPMTGIFYFLVIVIALVLDYYNAYSFSDLSLAFFQNLLRYKLLVIIPALAVAAMYWINYHYLKKSAYLEDLSLKRTNSTNAGNISFLSKFGEIGDYIGLDLKLILRNKRPRSLLFFSIFIFFYGFIYYGNDRYISGSIMLIVVGLLMISMFMLNFGQFIISWESSYLDSILSKNIDIRKYFEAKFWLLAASCTLSFLITIPYVYYGLNVLLINFALLLFSVGITSFLLLYFVILFNRKRIDISKGTAMNWQGVGAGQFIIAIPAFIMPLVVYTPFSLFGKTTWGILTIGSLGLISLLFFNKWLSLLVKTFQEKKHDIASGLRS